MDVAYTCDNRISTVTQCLAEFLTPESVRTLRAASREYRSAVSCAGSLDYLARRQTQRIVGEKITLPATSDHDWDRTHALLITDPFALYYTGNELDADIARKAGATLTCDVLTGVNTPIWHIEQAAVNGHFEAFTVLEEHFHESLGVANYSDTIRASLMSGCLEILSLPRVARCLGLMDPDGVNSRLSIIDDYCTPPRVADFFLSNVSLANVDTNPYLYNIIGRGAYGLVKVFLKHDLVPFGGSIDGAGYASGCDDYYGERWNPLWLAAKCGHLNIVRLLLADPRSKDIVLEECALHHAVEQGFVEIVRPVLDSGLAKIDEVYLPTAAEVGRLEMVKLLLSYPETKFSAYAIRHAIDNGHTDVALLLLEHFSDHTALNKKELLKLAAFAGDEAVIAALRG